MVELKRASVAQPTMLGSLVHMRVAKLAEQLMSVVLKVSICQPIPSFLFDESIAGINASCHVPKVKDCDIEENQRKVIWVIESLPKHDCVKDQIHCVAEPPEHLLTFKRRFQSVELFSFY